MPNVTSHQVQSAPHVCPSVARLPVSCARYGKVGEVKISRDTHGYSKRFAYVVLAANRTAEKVMKDYAKHKLWKEFWKVISVTSDEAPLAGQTEVIFMLKDPMLAWIAEMDHEPIENSMRIMLRAGLTPDKFYHDLKKPFTKAGKFDVIPAAITMKIRSALD